jgi:hypothetical protein
MSEWTRVYCRQCENYFLTNTPGSPKCDLCGKEGGVVSAEVADAERQERERQQVEEQRKRDDKPGTKPNYLVTAFTLLICFSAYQKFAHPAPVGSYTWWFTTSLLVIGVLGTIATMAWPKRKPPQPTEKNEPKA